jgi:pimeloyl-ACP methyl ester carboxylesterase
VTNYGQGPTILALHAFPTSSYDYSRIIPLLAARYRVILFDYPGFGFSDKPRSVPYSLLLYADALQFIASNYNITRTYLLAHDIGASIALEILSRGAPYVERFVMMNASVRIPAPQHPILLLGQAIMLHPWLGPLISRLRLLRRPLFAQTFCPLFARKLPRHELEAFWSLLHYNDGIAIYHQLLSYIPERRTYQEDWLQALARHQAPLTLIWGQADPIAIPSICDMVMTLRPDARAVRMAGVGHYPHWEAAAQTAAVIATAFAA